MFILGVEFLTKNITVDGKEYTLQIWDTAGQERFKSLRTPFYRGADCCILTYAVDDAQSFFNLKNWKGEFLYYADIAKTDFPFLVIGNKVDVEANKKQVTQRDAETWCKSNGGYIHLETSAKDSTNVEECFIRAVRTTVNVQLETGEASFSNVTSDTPSINLKTMTSQKANCC